MKMSKKQQKTSPNFPFFSIPNPNSLLRSIDIPAPIIHPPGVDPHSLLNPMPHGDGALESQTPPPLDIDPGAASRSEIITMKTDLSVSELAGGTYSETTTVLATSDSPANSEVVIQQTVNDMVANNFEYTQTTVCDVCNVICNSKDALKMHKEGKKHLKNMQKLTVSSAIEKETQPTVALNATLYQESEKNDLLQNKPLVDSLVIDNIPDLGKYSRDVKVEQPVGEKHVTQVPNGLFGSNVLPKPTSMSFTLAQPSNNITQKAQGELNIRQFTWCKICKVNCSSESNFERHIFGKKHLKNLKTFEKEIVPPSTMPLETVPATKTLEALKPGEHESGEIVDSEEVVNPNEVKSLRCELCRICCNSSEDLNKHLLGQKHQKKMKKSKELFKHGPAERPLEGPMNNVVILDAESGKRKADRPSDEDLFRKRQKVVTKEEEKCGAYATCKVCNVVCTAVEAFRSHLASHEHSAMVLKQVKIVSK